MPRIADIDESRRQFLLYLLASGAFAATPGSSIAMPAAMPPGRSIHRLRGDVKVNGVAATTSTRIRPGDTIQTGDRSFAIFVVEKDAFILRSNSSMEIPPRKVKAGLVPTAYTLKRGKALSVLASRRTNILTPSAVIGVRGTGVYVESEPEQSYVCVCYGISDLSVAGDPSVTETVAASHHDAPKYIISEASGNRIEPAPFKNHDDEELLLIETLVGRTPPYVVPQGAPRTRSNYF